MSVCKEGDPLSLTNLEVSHPAMGWPFPWDSWAGVSAGSQGDIGVPLPAMSLCSFGFMEVNL